VTVEAASHSSGVAAALAARRHLIAVERRMVTT
jgi:hypothetical protein